MKITRKNVFTVLAERAKKAVAREDRVPPASPVAISDPFEQRARRITVVFSIIEQGMGEDMQPNYLVVRHTIEEPYGSSSIRGGYYTKEGALTRTQDEIKLLGHRFEAMVLIFPKIPNS